jgi:hypothetical protein
MVFEHSFNFNILKKSQIYNEKIKKFKDKNKDIVLFGVKIRIFDLVYFHKYLLSKA